MVLHRRLTHPEHFRITRFRSSTWPENHQLQLDPQQGRPLCWRNLRGLEAPCLAIKFVPTSCIKDFKLVWLLFANSFRCSGSSSFSSSYEYPQFFVLVQWLRATIRYHFLKKISACLSDMVRLRRSKLEPTKMMVRRVFSACGLKLNDINIMSNKTLFVPKGCSRIFDNTLQGGSVGLVVEQGSDGNGPPRAVFGISDEQCAFSLPPPVQSCFLSPPSDCSINKRGQPQTGALARISIAENGASGRGVPDDCVKSHLMAGGRGLVDVGCSVARALGPVDSLFLASQAT